MYKTRWRALLFGAALVVALSAGPSLAQAQGPSAVEQALADLEGALRNEEGLSAETKAALTGLIRALRVERETGGAFAAPSGRPEKAVDDEAVAEAVDAYLETKKEEGGVFAWDDALKRLSLYGGLRPRHESTVNRDTGLDRHREHPRFRLGELIEITFPSLSEGLSKNWGLYQAKRGTSVDGTVPFFCDLGKFILVRSLGATLALTEELEFGARIHSSRLLGQRDQT